MLLGVLGMGSVLGVFCFEHLLAWRDGDVYRFARSGVSDWEEMGYIYCERRLLSLTAACTTGHTSGFVRINVSTQKALYWTVESNVESALS